MISVLFVCLGNICRSPMAEALFRDMVNKENLNEKFLVDSAATVHGKSDYLLIRELLIF